MIKKKNISQEDINAWNNYIKNPTDITDKDSSNKANLSNKHRFIFDLHGFTLVDANKKVREIILSCVKKNYKEVLFITGKGIHSNTEKDVYVSKDLSKLKYSVPQFIKSDSVHASPRLLCLSCYARSIPDRLKFQSKSYSQNFRLAD